LGFILTSAPLTRGVYIFCYISVRFTSDIAVVGESLWPAPSEAAVRGRTSLENVIDQVYRITDVEVSVVINIAAFRE
jgi:hypothetical protein